MSAGMETSREDLTLTDPELTACKPIAGEGGHVLRALCPFHGSDHQRSLRVEWYIVILIVIDIVISLLEKVSG